jgi:hypothetical protein
MTDNAVRLSLPPFSSNSNTIRVSGTDQSLIKRAIRAFMRLSCDIYIASIQTFSVADNPESFNKLVQDLQPLLFQITNDLPVHIQLSRNIIDLFGAQEPTKKAFEMLVDSAFLKQHIRDTKFQIELALEHKDFINGKKNGKINKIVKSSNCRISFQETLNEYNMLIDIYNSAVPKLLLGVQLLEDELPAETSFHIPESFHKRIIGVGGKNIQKIMKRLGIYVKFSNAQEFEERKGYYENQDNVIARTPRKNKENLENLKHVIVDSVNATELLEERVEINLSRQLHLIVCGEMGCRITQFEELGVSFSLPNRESGMNTLILSGPPDNVSVCQKKIESSIPKIMTFQVISTPNLAQLLKSDEYLNFIAQIENSSNVTVKYYISMSGNVMYYLLSASESLETVKDKLVHFFKEHKVNTQAKEQADPFSYDSFKHFNSKLLQQSSKEFLFFQDNDSKTSFRELFDDGKPPGLKKSPSDVRGQSIIGQAPGNQSAIGQLSMLGHSNSSSTSANQHVSNPQNNANSMSRPSMISRQTPVSCINLVILQYSY